MLELIRRLTKRPCAQCEKLGRNLEAMKFRFGVASKCQAAYDRRIAAFKRDHPALWAQYFSKQGASTNGKP